MNDLYDQLRNWLDVLVEHEYRDVVRSFLSAEEQNRLPTPVQSVNRGDFLGFTQQLKRLEQLEIYLQKRFPGRFTNGMLQVVTLPQRLPFTNREDEIKFVTYTHAPAYFLLDAPAGYGKSELLKELKKRFSELNWRCAYTALEQNSTLSDLTGILANELDNHSRLAPDSQLPWGLRLGGALRRQWESSPMEGLVLLIDLEKMPSPLLYKDLLEQFIPDIQMSLCTLEYFSRRQNRLRVIIAGRHLAIIHNDVKTSLPFAILSLSPFNYDVIRSSVGSYLVDQDERSKDQLSAHLLYLSGGHPGCVSQIIEEYRYQGIPPDEFIKHFDKETWKDIVRRAVEEVSDGIPKGKIELYDIVDQLSLFRYVDSSILRQTMQKHKISNIKNEHDLGDELTGTYLFERKGRFLQDGITRRLLTIRAWRQSPDMFASRCRDARDVCAVRLRESNVQMPEIWMIEYLWLFLQQHAAMVQELK